MASNETLDNPPLPSGLRKEREDPKFSDVVVVVDGKEYPCHKLVLGRTSEYFMGLFESEMRETVEDRVTLEEITCETFEKLLNWMYHGDPVIDAENEFDIILAANRLQIESLLLRGKLYLMNNVSADNCGRVYNISQIRQWKDLETSAWDILVTQFDTVGVSELDVLSAGDMKNLVSSSALVTRSEDLVVEKVLKWVSQGEEGSGDDGEDPFVPQEGSRRKYLLELLQACRYLLVSFTFYWEMLSKHPLVQKDEGCQAILREILQYKTHPDSHQYGCPTAAIHREKSSRVNVMLNVLTSKSIYFNTLPQLKGKWKTFGLPFPTTFAFATAVSVYDGIIYFLDGTSSQLCAYDTKSKRTVCCTSANKARMKTFAMLPVENALIALCSSDNSIYTIRRIQLPCCDASWEQIGSLSTRGKEFVCATNIGPKFISFWEATEQGSFCIECYDLVRGSSFTFIEKLALSRTAVPLKKGEQTFILQGNGQLWRLNSRAEAPYVELEKLRALWTGEHELRAAMIACERLTIYRTCPEPDILMKWCEAIGTDGLFSSADYINIKENFAGVISVVVDKSTTPLYKYPSPNAVPYETDYNYI